MRAAIILPLTLAWLTHAASADELPRTDRMPPIVLSNAEIEARLEFLEQRLDEGRPTALAWEWGWTTIYSLSFVQNLVQAISADEGDDRVRAIVDAAKSGLATTQMTFLLLDPLAAGLGAQPMRDVLGDGRSARLQRLAVGETQLLKTVARAESRYSVRRHLITIGANLLGGAAILALGDSGDALRSTVAGIAVGEAQIWTQPWRATADLRDYNASFGGNLGSAWQLRPMGAGAQLAIRF